MGSSSAISLAAIADAIEVRVPGLRRQGDALVSDVHIDSRTVTSGSLYVAIRGARADGHDYLGIAVEKGAQAVVVDHQP